MKYKGNRVVLRTSKEALKLAIKIFNKALGKATNEQKTT